MPDLKEKLKKFREAGCTYDNWKKIVNKKRRNKDPQHRICTYVYKENQAYFIRKTCNSKNYRFGTYSSLEKAKTVKNFLEYKQWDLQYLPKNVLNCKRSEVDEYYCAMIPYITCDKGYENYLQK